MRARQVRRWIALVATVGVAVLLAALPVSGSQAATTAVAPAGSIKHVVWIVDENHSYSQIVGASKDVYLNSLATTYGSANNDWGITHPSVPNYLGLSSGLPLSSLPTTDCTKCTQAGASLFTQGESWRTYEESMPVVCDHAASTDGLYQPKHNPALYFTNVPSSSCIAYDQPYTTLASDLSHSSLPAFALIVPNMNDDMHTGTNLQGQSWLQAQLPALLTSTEFTSGSMVIFITWDEGTTVGEVDGSDCTLGTSNSCHVPLLVLSHWTHAVNYSGKLTHYSVLKATEDLLGLPELGQAATAPSLLVPFGL